MADTSSPLPVLYARWARELLGGDPPNETRSTCLDCAMAMPPGTPGDAGVTFFNPQTKCCTYTPVLPNFLAGAILADASPEAAHGRASMLARIAAREKITPLGVDRPAAVEAVYTALAPDRFGTDMTMRCPHMTPDALCGVWRHRNSVCATWFCKHERGAVSDRFWTHVREWLREIERQLATWCVAQEGLDLAAMGRLLMPARSAGFDPRPLPAPDPSSGWGSWSGREAEFYEACATRVASLSGADVARIGGASVAARGAVVREMFSRLNDATIPDRLVAAPLIVVKRTPASAIVLTYRGTDLLELEEDALTVVRRFDGRPTADVLRVLEEEDGLAVEPELVSYLRDFDILRDPTDR